MTSTGSNMKWKGWTPLKCKIMVWRADLNRLPTKMELIKRTVTIEDMSCVLCEADSETAIHLFTGCIFSSEIWARVALWCKLAPLFVFDVKDLLSLAETQTKTKQERYILRGIIFTTMWTIWNERNSRVFGGKPPENY
ncbi:uncharacterized protein LOC110875619 [Helianthus annuus]|uniref:uncharacterized protein LOC110875619 n=1 Tax=Helianthus annuus TaxID=4232 RepID=UPI000B8F0F38|nr:uncharacterized protein LOC110875619 [Helianthus annuus]